MCRGALVEDNGVSMPNGWRVTRNADRESQSRPRWVVLKEQKDQRESSWIVEGREEAHARRYGEMQWGYVMAPKHWRRALSERVR